MFRSLEQAAKTTTVGSDTCAERGIPMSMFACDCV